MYHFTLQKTIDLICAPFGPDCALCYRLQHWTWRIWRLLHLLWLASCMQDTVKTDQRWRDDHMVALVPQQGKSMCSASKPTEPMREAAQMPNYGAQFCTLICCEKVNHTITCYGQNTSPNTQKVMHESKSLKLGPVQALWGLSQPPPPLHKTNMPPTKMSENAETPSAVWSLDSHFRWNPHRTMVAPKVIWLNPHIFGAYSLAHAKFHASYMQSKITRKMHIALACGEAFLGEACSCVQEPFQ